MNENTEDPKVAFEGVRENRAGWVEARKGKIGSSEIVTVCGLNPYESRLELWARFTGKTGDKPETPAMRYGRAVEPVIMELFQVAHPELTVTPNDTTFEDSENPKFIATPDGWWSRGDLEGILEIKHSANDQGWEDGGAPDLAHCQIMWQLGICKRKAAYIGAVLKGRAAELRDPFFEFEPTIFSQLKEQAEKFLNMVEKDIPPDPGPGDSKLIDAIVERDPTKTYSFSDEEERVLMKLLEVKEKLKEASKDLRAIEAEKKLLENLLKLRMGAATTGLFQSGYVAKVNIVQKSGYTMPPTSYSTITINRSR